MALDKIEQRHELINDMIDEAFAFADMAKDFEDDNDLAAAKITLDYLIAAERLICAEEIFMDTFYRMSNTRYPNRDEQEELLTIFLVDGVYAFSNEVWCATWRTRSKSSTSGDFVRRTASSSKNIFATTLKHSSKNTTRSTIFNRKFAAFRLFTSLRGGCIILCKGG